MKQMFFLFVFFCVAQYTLAQKLAIAADGKITENGAYVARYEKTGNGTSVIVNADEDDLVTIEETEDEELRTNYYTITFNDDANSTAYVPRIKSKDHISAVLLAKKIIKNGALNPEAVKNFCASYTMEALAKKNEPKLQKEIAKEQKAASKEAQNEENEEIAEQKKEAKAEKLSAKKDAMQEKREEREARIQDKKEARDDKRSANDTEEEEEATPAPAKKPVPIIAPVKPGAKPIAPAVAPPPSRNKNASIILEEGKIEQDGELIGLYGSATGLVNKKKGQVITLYNKDKKKIAVAKYQQGATSGTMQLTGSNSVTPFDVPVQDDEFIVRELVMTLIAQGIL